MRNFASEILANTAVNWSGMSDEVIYRHSFKQGSRQQGVVFLSANNSQPILSGVTSKLNLYSKTTVGWLQQSPQKVMSFSLYVWFWLHHSQSQNNYLQTYYLNDWLSCILICPDSVAPGLLRLGPDCRQIWFQWDSFSKLLFGLLVHTVGHCPTGSDSVQHYTDVGGSVPLSRKKKSGFNLDGLKFGFWLAVKTRSKSPKYITLPLTGEVRQAHRIKWCESTIQLQRNWC